MQKLIFKISFLLSLFLMSCGGGGGSVKESTVHVWGNNEKCKITIEKACVLDGVKDADWGVDSKLLTVKYDTTKVSLDFILESVSKAGYDNEKFFANDYAYEALEPACQYERRPFESK
jgi:mercuric ion binding protein